MTEHPALPKYSPNATPNATEGPFRPVMKGSNGLGVASMVLGLLGFFPVTNVLAIVFGIASLVQLRRRIQAGKGFAIAGMVAAVAWWAFWVAIIIGIENEDRTGQGSAPVTGLVAIEDLTSGQCVNGIDDGRRKSSLVVVQCGALHQGEVFSVFDLAGESFPGTAEVTRRSENGCSDRLAAYAPSSVDDPSIYVVYFAPVAATWSDDQSVVCIAVSDDRTAGTIRD